MSDHIFPTVARLYALRLEGKAHAVRIRLVDEGIPDWGFDCLHDEADEEWAYRDPTGNISNWQPGECWLESWWSNCGAELLDLRGRLHAFPLPVKPDDEWDYDNGGRLVVDA